MAACDLCGKSVPLIPTQIEGSELMVCEKCSRHGKILRSPNLQEYRKTQVTHREISLDIVENYAQLIRKQREIRELVQEEFAKQLNEKVTLLQKIEAGTIKPTIDLARKLEHLLSIKLIKEIKDESEYQEPAHKRTVFTIGDFIKIKKR